MTEQVFLTKLQEDVLDTDADITMDMKLDDIVEWDSLSSVSFIAMVNVDKRKKLEHTAVQSAETIRDLYNLLG